MYSDRCILAPVCTYRKMSFGSCVHVWMGTWNLEELMKNAELKKKALDGEYETWIKEMPTKLMRKIR